MLLGLLSIVVSLAAAQTSVDRTVKIYAWPISSPKPQELAQISYGSNVASSKASISKYSAPKIDSGVGATDELVRVGLYDPTTNEWHGIVTSVQNFDPKYQQKISLHVDLDHNPWHVGLTAYTKPTSTQKVRREGQDIELVPQAVAEIVLPVPAPTPHLNKPVVLSPDGKVETEAKDEKTFLQKYWW